ncbi:MAG: DUF11 domain-containing protein [Pirellulales bacterium]|nr:DUF11 domain-containing protein [Pirellulales bacterium]
MRTSAAGHATVEPWPRIWRIVVIALCTLILCSCRGPAGPATISGPAPPCPAPPPDAYAGALAMAPAGYVVPGTPGAPLGPPGMEQGIPLPYAPAGPWAPPGFRQPWPADEYLCDGGDTAPAAQVMADWEVRGLNVEDTVAHYDTVDGRTLVEPSNRVCLYSPRFRAVRQVVSARQNEQSDRTIGVAQPEKLAGHQEVLIADTSTQNLQAERQVSQAVPVAFRTRQGDGAISTAIGPVEFQNQFLPFEDFAAIRTGQIDTAEMPFLAECATAAIVWTNKQAVQIILENQRATAAIGVDEVSSVYTIDEPPGCPKLRVIKVASTQFAEPGDTVDFTIRFDNIGNQPIGNVTIMDNLTTRLEYVPDTAQSSIPAQFSVQPNEAGSLVLRWEVADPMKVGDGGIVRFRCRVR